MTNLHKMGQGGRGLPITWGRGSWKNLENIKNRKFLPPLPSIPTTIKHLRVLYFYKFSNEYPHPITALSENDQLP